MCSASPLQRRVLLRFCRGVEAPVLTHSMAWFERAMHSRLRLPSTVSSKFQALRVQVPGIPAPPPTPPLPPCPPPPPCPSPPSSHQAISATHLHLISVPPSPHPAQPTLSYTLLVPPSAPTLLVFATQPAPGPADIILHLISVPISCTQPSRHYPAPY